MPISPTRAFYHQVRFYDYALRRLGGVYADAKLLVVVGDNADIREVKDANAWSASRNVEWMSVPTEIFDRYGIHGTADYRYFPETEADIVILSDADTVFARDIDPVVGALIGESKAVAGHMAHAPPAVATSGPFAGLPVNELWPDLLAAFDLRMPEALHRYSMDSSGQFKPIPAYFNLGFVALSGDALREMREHILATQDRLLAIFPSHMRCQIAVTLIALKAGLKLYALPAQYNLANDMGHLSANFVEADDVRVLHYLRDDELRREEIALPERISDVLEKKGLNPINQKLQSLVCEYARAEFGMGD